MKRAPPGKEEDKEKGDAFGFFSAFKFVKEAMATEANAIMRRSGAPAKGKPTADAAAKGQRRDPSVPKTEESKMAAAPKDGLLNPLTASARARAGGRKASLRLGDDDFVEEVRESTFVPTVPGGESPDGKELGLE
jgi:hypothetical protein